MVPNNKDYKIYFVDKKNEEKFLRKGAADFDFAKHSKKEINDLIKQMRIIMKRADGVGLSANQIGLDIRVFVAEVDNKFYAVFNPKIIKVSEVQEEDEEGCLSVPERFGKVDRAEKIWLEALDRRGKRLKIKAWGFLARVFQHEVDHLDGKLFIDRAKSVYQIKPLNQ